MSDEHNSGTEVPPASPATAGAFDWLVESHRQSVPMAPLPEAVPSPAAFELPDPAMQPPVAAWPPAPPFTPAPPTPSVFALPPVLSEPAAPEPTPQAAQATVVAPAVTESPSVSREIGEPHGASVPPEVSVAPEVPEPPEVSDAQHAPFSFASEPLAPSGFGGGPGPAALALERHGGRPRSANGPLDWAALVLAFLAPPIGLLLGIFAVVTGSRARGYATSIAKAAIGIGAALSIVLGIAIAVETKVAGDQAAHQAIVDSSAAWCTKLNSNPQTLSSDTFAWPAPGDTVPQSLVPIEAYVSRWESLTKVAPAGIRVDTRKVVDAAKTIEASVRSTSTLDDANNIAQMQNVVATSGIQAWAASYCK